MKIGDKVKFTGDYGNTIPNYYYREIPANKIVHGNTSLGETYKKDFAKIVDTHDQYYIVSYMSADGQEVRLGFLPESLELVEKKKTGQEIRIEESVENCKAYDPQKMLDNVLDFYKEVEEEKKKKVRKNYYSFEEDNAKN